MRAACAYGPDLHLCVCMPCASSLAFIWVQAVWEEVGELSCGRKHRLEMQLVTPENPHYWFNYAEVTADVDVDAPPIYGRS